ncbi:selenoprotein W-like [Molossus nigricans]
MGALTPPVCEPLGISGYKPKYLQLKQKLEDEFPGRLDICGEATPKVTGFFEVTVAGRLVHSKKGGHGYVDTENKFLKLVAAIKSALAQADVP